MEKKLITASLIFTALSSFSGLFAQNINDEMYAPVREIDVSLRLAIQGPEGTQGDLYKESVNIVTVTTADLLPAGYKYYLSGFEWDWRVLIAGPNGQIIDEALIQEGMYDVESYTEQISTGAASWTAAYNVSIPLKRALNGAIVPFLNLQASVLDKGTVSAVSYATQIPTAVASMNLSTLSVIGDGSLNPTPVYDGGGSVVVLSGFLSSQMSNVVVDVDYD